MKEKKILIVTSVSAEKEAILSGIKGNNRFDVIAAGVGTAAAAARTARALAAAEYCMVVNAGIGGGFPGQAEVGSIVVANKIIAADLGAQTTEGFNNLEKLGFGSTCFQVEDELTSPLTDRLRSAGVVVQTGPILTVSTVTGTQMTAIELAERIPGAAAEAMEGFGAATAARDQGLPIIEIRAISNLVGPRDRTSWRIEEALNALKMASSVLVEVLT
jgi:futalosine hydrolase